MARRNRGQESDDTARHDGTVHGIGRSRRRHSTYVRDLEDTDFVLRKSRRKIAIARIGDATRSKRVEGQPGRIAGGDEVAVDIEDNLRGIG